MSNLFITADKVGIQTGGGIVTQHEYDALKALGECETFSRDWFEGVRGEDPWLWDDYLSGRSVLVEKKYDLAHFYAGTFTKTIALLKRKGTKITYTAAAHDVAISKREHEKLGIPYNYPHLTEPELWQRYVKGYLEADVLICPSQHSANVMRGFGAKNRIEVIPHGCEIPTVVKPYPKTFTVGYLGSFGADKGIPYLLQAWKQLNYKDAVLLLGGRDSTSDYVSNLIAAFGGGNIWQVGWVKDVSDFYNQISLYVQPSCSEGFGIEVLEAMAHSRQVICSEGAGASDVVMPGWVFEACNVESLAVKIDQFKERWLLEKTGIVARLQAEDFTWNKIRQRYVDVWKSLLEERD